MNQPTFKDFERIQVDSHPYLEIFVAEGSHPTPENQFKIQLAAVIDDFMDRDLLTQGDKDIIEQIVQSSLYLKEFRNPECLVLGYKLNQSPAFENPIQSIPFSQIFKYKRMWESILN